MGLAANQARLLTLTSRMNDLEAQSMRYTNQKMLMAMKQTEVATKYSNGLERIDDIKPTEVGPTEGTTTQVVSKPVEVNYKNLLKMNYGISLNSAAEKGLRSRQIVGYEQKEVPNDGARTAVAIENTKGTWEPLINKANTDVNSRLACARTVNTSQGIMKAPQSPAELKDMIVELGLAQCLQESANGKVVFEANIPIQLGDRVCQQGEQFTLKELSYYLDIFEHASIKSVDGEVDDPKGAFPNIEDHIDYTYSKLCQLVDPDVNLNIGGEAGPTKWVDDLDKPIYEEANTDKGNEVWANIQGSAAGLLQAWKNGDIIISFDGQKIEYSENAIDLGTTEEVVTVTNTSGLTTLDYSARNAARDALEAEYDREMNKIQAAEKRLDMLAKQVETQYQACCTEVDSVKSLIEKNTDRSFNLFG